MTEPFVERRAVARTELGAPIEVIVDGKRHPAELQNISPFGLNAKLAEGVIITGAEVIEAIALEGGAPLGVKVKWELFDGCFGAAFTDVDAAEAQVGQLLAG